MPAIVKSASTRQYSALKRSSARKNSIQRAAPAVFGAAPSLDLMLHMNKMMKGKKTLFRGAYFWYHFRVFYPYVFPVFFVVFMIVALAGWTTIEGPLVLGSILSLFSSLAVCVSYVMIIPWRKHPSKLVLYKSLTSILFSVNMILEAISTTSESCRSYAMVTHIALLASECWLTTIALDLVYSLTNPFVSYTYSMRKYQIMVWSFTFFISLLFYSDTSCQGSFSEGICWVKISSARSPCLWGYYLSWVIMMYAYQMYAFVFAWFRLKRGLPATFEIRKKCAEETFKCLMSYAIYLSVLVIMFWIISGSTSPNQSMHNFSMLFLFLVANRGSMDGIVWFMLHDFARDSPEYVDNIPDEDDYYMEGGGGGGSQGFQTPSRKTSDPRQLAATSPYGGDTAVGVGEAEAGDGEASTKSPLSGLGKFSLPTSINLNMPILLDINLATAVDDVTEAAGALKKEMSQTITKLADLAILEYDESDLSPQVNMALRQQILHHVTTGIRTAVTMSLEHSITGTSQLIMGLEAVKQVFAEKINKDNAIVEGLEVTEFLMDKEYKFKSFASTKFHEMRLREGISSDDFLEAIAQPANERLSEGASGAFMFFCGDNQYIVKTIRCREARVLHKMLPDYFLHLQNLPESYLCRIVGSYSLQMFEQTFYFIVMKNCFDPKVYINDRYDIKGSWVDRSAKPAPSSKKCVCRHCNTYFVPSAEEVCMAVVGFHEANEVLKDNDMRTKISLNDVEAHRIYDILKKDSDLLSRMGVLDYSLLVGVKKWRFDVSVSDEEMLMDRPQQVDRHQRPWKSRSSDKLASIPEHDVVEHHEDPNLSAPGGADGFHSAFRGLKATSVTGPAVYYLGIVDFLQDWTFMKKVERAVKIYVQRRDAEGISVMEPGAYMQRFQNKMAQILDVDHEDEEMSESDTGSEAVLTPAFSRRHSGNFDSSDNSSALTYSTTNAPFSPVQPAASSYAPYSPATSGVVNPLHFEETAAGSGDPRVTVTSSGCASACASGNNSSKSVSLAVTDDDDDDAGDNAGATFNDDCDNDDEGEYEVVSLGESSRSSKFRRPPGAIASVKNPLQSKST